jgi:hypothetical protein
MAQPAGPVPQIIGRKSNYVDVLSTNDEQLSLSQITWRHVLLTRCARSSITARPARVSRWRFAPGQRRLQHRRRSQGGAGRRLRLVTVAPGYRSGRKVLVGADTAGGTHEFVHHLHVRRLQYSVGFQVTAARPVPVARGRKRSYGAKRLFLIQSALTMVWSAPRWGSERFGSG